ncbi:MAG: Rdx family protein [Candidatus Promineifilaceae bacterium]
MPRAIRVVDEILGNYQHIVKDFRLIMGSKGVFEFRVNDELIFSKKTIQRRHAEPGEILEMFRQIIGPDVPVYQ